MLRCLNSVLWCAHFPNCTADSSTFDGDLGNLQERARCSECTVPWLKKNWCRCNVSRLNGLSALCLSQWACLRTLLTSKTPANVQNGDKEVTVYSFVKLAFISTSSHMRDVSIRLSDVLKESCAEEGRLVDEESESGAEDKPSPESSTLKPFLWISCDRIRPKLFFFVGKTPCFWLFWFYDLNAKGSQRRLHLLWCRFQAGVASGLIPRTISWRIFAGVCRYTFEAGDLRLLLSQLPCSWWLFCISQDIFLTSEKPPYGRNTLQKPLWPRWLVACACSWCKFRCCLVSPPYRRPDMPDIFRFSEWRVA